MATGRGGCGTATTRTSTASSSCCSTATSAAPSSICETEEGKETARRLIRDADIVAENLGPGRHGTARARLRGRQGAQPARDLRLGQGLRLVWPVQRLQMLRAGGAGDLRRDERHRRGRRPADGQRRQYRQFRHRHASDDRHPRGARAARAHRPRPARRGRDAGGGAEPDPGQIHADPGDRDTAGAHRQPLGDRRLVGSVALLGQRLERLRLHDHPARQSGDVRGDDRGHRAPGSAHRRALCDAAGARPQRRGADRRDRAAGRASARSARS